MKNEPPPIAYLGDGYVRHSMLGGGPRVESGEEPHDPNLVKPRPFYTPRFDGIDLGIESILIGGLEERAEPEK